MAGPQLRFATLLLLLVAIACSCSVSSVAAEAPLAPHSRALRHQVQQSDGTTTQTDSAVQTAVPNQSSSASNSGSGAETTSATANTAASAESTEPEHEGPPLMSFVGPAIAGVLAIVLIGAVVTFKNRMGK